ncbi:penicillin-binding protein activator [Sphingomonas ginkgonis]|uniref:Penicillin-binding protein activator n=1 Tax=Sphingomonas ginkgonis TaxID=2315330 RepID=A0A3R9WSQ2_9SPHN|nr:penicillin-binding protein activator [Sphingomonas ginkgonis]RST30876.1 penicillin-binding protein activator [Sphingomonas ginkgonis]
MTSSLTLRQAWLWAAATATLLAGCARGGGNEPQVLPRPPGEMASNGVAVIVPLSGENGAVGQSLANAARLALLDSGNQALRLKVYDSNRAGAAAAMFQALGDGNRLVLGPLLAADVRAVAPVAARANVPVVAFSNDESVAGNGVYILGITPGQSIDRVVRYTRQQGAARFAALTPQTIYGERAAPAFAAAVQRSGGVVAGAQTYGRTADGLRGAARAIAAGSPDAVLVADGARAAASAAAVLKPGPQRRLLGTELWAGERDLGASPALRGALFAAAPNQRYGQFVQRYRARFGSAPFRISSLGYDAVLLTIRAARGWSANKRFPVRQLLDSDGFAGVDGIFRFGRNGIAQRALEVRRVTAAGSEVVSPAATSFGA